MNLRYIQFVAILLWGFRVDELLFAIPMAMLFEARFFTDRRWALTRQDFYRVADLTAIGLIGLLLFLFLNRAEYHFITTLVQWLPILFYPLMIVLAWSTTERMPLDVLFYSLRRQREPVTQSWDMSYVFFGLCLVGAGTTKAGQTWYLIAVALLVFAALFQLRSRRYHGNLWLLLAMSIFLAGTLGHQGIRAAHLEIKEMSQRWLAQFIERRTNPLKTKSAIGAIGRLKSSDEIEFRVKSLDGGPPPSLLQEATYDSPSGTDWLVLNPQFDVVTPYADFTWRFRDRVPGESRAKIYLEFGSETALVPVPGNVTEIFDLPATDIRLSKFGSIQGEGLVASPGYEVSFRRGDTIDSEPDRSDIFVPPEYEETFEALLPTPASDALDARNRVRELLSGFEYSLYQDVPQRRDPLIHFLTEAQAGHCEYFASATVLALRHLGVPARYAVGFSVQEYDDAIDMYIVRKRHAHAWAIAWIDDRWQVVDTTPAVWRTAEAGQSGMLRPVADFFSNRLFLLQLWWSEQRIEDYQTELYIIGGLLVCFLIWRIATSEQVRLNNQGRDDEDASQHRQGLDSPFFRIEETLAADGFARARGESFERWIRRIGHEELRPMLPLHNRLRFDPAGAPRELAAELEHRVNEWFGSRSGSA